MAIKVNGTTVIDDSRALSNIASVDATTVASLGAAGVGGGKNNVTTELIVTSKTYTVPFDCDMHVLVCGAGGGGAACQTGTSAGGNGRATGGAAGGVAVKLFTGVSAGDTVSVTIGAKGNNAQLPVTSGALAVNGSAGGNTSATYSGTTLTGNGGGGGTAAANTTERTSNAGGSASGGDTNITGATSSTNYVTAHTPGNRKAAAGAMASGVSSTEGVPTLDQNTGSGNFTTTLLTAEAYTRDEQFTQAHTSVNTIPGGKAGLYYNTNALYFGINSAGGRGVTNYDAYTYCEAGLPGHLGGGGGGVVHGHENTPYYKGKNDNGAQNDSCRGGRGGVGFVHLVFLKSAEDL
jgi:hypothetical protein